MRTKYFSSVIIATFFILSVFVITSLSCNKSDNGGNPPPSEGGGITATLNILSMTFPPTTTVKIGTTVKWVNTDYVSHTVTANDGTFDGSINAGESFSYVASKAGTFPYYCKIHAGMTSTLTVTP